MDKNIGRKIEQNSADRKSGKRVLIGSRVQVPTYTDEWMMGARYGYVVDVMRSANRAIVDHDHGFRREYILSDLTRV